MHDRSPAGATRWLNKVPEIKGDLAAATARIKALEGPWDSKEAGLKPGAPGDWHVLDRTIDKALTALRADTPDQVDCKAAMVGLLKTFDALQGRV